MDYLIPFLKKAQDYFGKYGNPDIQILRTLKIKNHFYSILDILIVNMRSNMIFRVAIYW